MLQKIQTILLGLAVVGVGILAVRQEQLSRKTNLILEVAARQSVNPTDATLELRAIDAWMVRRASEQFEKLPDQEKTRIMDEAQREARLLANQEAFHGGASKLSLLSQTEPTPAWSWMYPHTQSAK